MSEQKPVAYELKPCPFCGSAARIHGESIVACTNNDCSGQVDFGHWCGEENGVPAIYWVVQAWNKRTPVDVQAAIDAALESVAKYIDVYAFEFHELSTTQQELFAVRDEVRSRINTHPLAERDARIDG